MTTSAAIIANATSATFATRLLDLVPGVELIPALAAGLVMALSLGQLF